MILKSDELNDYTTEYNVGRISINNFCLLYKWKGIVT